MTSPADDIRADATPPARSWLFVPANSPRMVQKALSSSADAAVFDLEDAVPAPQKASARDTLSSLLRQSPPGQVRRYVRVNHPRNAGLFQADLACVSQLPVEGLFLPKMNSTDELHEAIEALMDTHEREGQPLRVVIMIEGPQGLLAAASLAVASPRVAGLAFGAEDFAQAMGLPMVRTGDARELLYARSSVAVAAAAAGIEAIDMAWTDLTDADGLAAEAAQARRLGFTGKLAIHPAQLDAINTAFMPGENEVEHARGIIKAFEAAQATGKGTAAYQGVLVDEPIVEQAHRILRRAER